MRQAGFAAAARLLDGDFIKQGAVEAGGWRGCESEFQALT
jgi:hypothetical protein